MDEKKPFQRCSLVFLTIVLFFHSGNLSASVAAQCQSPVNSQLVCIEVFVKDFLQEEEEVTIQSAEFNGEVIPLNPCDGNGNRGMASFQLVPGKYTLSWITQRDKSTPNTMKHDEIVTVGSRDLLLQISIVGDESIRDCLEGVCKSSCHP